MNAQLRPRLTLNIEMGVKMTDLKNYVFFTPRWHNSGAIEPDSITGCFYAFPVAANFWFTNTKPVAPCKRVLPVSEDKENYYSQNSIPMSKEVMDQFDAGKVEILFWGYISYGQNSIDNLQHTINFCEVRYYPILDGAPRGPAGLRLDPTCRDVIGMVAGAT